MLLNVLRAPPFVSFFGGGGGAGKIQNKKAEQNNKPQLRSQMMVLFSLVEAAPGGMSRWFPAWGWGTLSGPQREPRKDSNYFQKAK